MHITQFLILAAVGASAHPSGHAHLHRQVHSKRNPEPNPAVGDVVTATINGKVVSWVNTYDGSGSPFVKDGKPSDAPVVAAAVAPKPKPSPTSASVAAAKSTPTPTPASSSPTPASSPASDPSSDSNSNSSDNNGTISTQGVRKYTAFCGGQSSVTKRATAANIAYVGNTGSASNWGCNMLLVADAATAAKYKFTMKITNMLANQQQSCTCFNKIGPSGLIDGFFHQAITWTMAAGATQFIAFDDNSQGGCVCNAGNTIRKTSNGQLAGTWIESDFGSSVNSGWSGADISSIVANNHNMQVDGAQVCYAGTCSTIYPGGKADNAYTGGMENADGVGLNIPPGNVQLAVKVGFSG